MKKTGADFSALFSDGNSHNVLFSITDSLKTEKEAEKYLNSPKDETINEYNPIVSGKNIANLRMSKGYSQKELAEILGVTQQNIHQIESGKKKISLKMLSGMMQVFETTSDYLLGFSVDMQFIKLREQLEEILNSVYRLKKTIEALPAEEFERCLQILSTSRYKYDIILNRLQSIESNLALCRALISLKSSTFMRYRK